MKCSRAAAFSAWVGVVVNDILGEMLEVLRLVGIIEVLSGRSMVARSM